MHQDRSPRDIFRGVLLLARGRSVGVLHFGNTPRALLSSLAPLLALPIVGFIVAHHPLRQALIDLLSAVCAVLVNPVLSYEIARMMGRRALWLRYATAMNWCQWAIPMVAFLMMFVVITGILVAGTPFRTAGAWLLGAVFAYGLWLYWFVARVGLAINAWRAAVLVVCVSLGSAAVALVPQLMAGVVPVP